MWFQDLFNYDFRRTERCIIPYATQEGEISFCAYSTGIGWRNIIEKMHMTATLTKWYDEHGRHQIYAGGKAVELNTTEHTLVLDAEAVAKGKQTDPDQIGVAKNAREEKLRAQKQKSGHFTPEDEKMADVECRCMNALWSARDRTRITAHEKPCVTTRPISAVSGVGCFSLVQLPWHPL
jgi:hypothetical protein